MKTFWTCAVALALGLAGLASPEAARAVSLRKGQRPVTMVALPLQNKSGDASLDWLSVGIQHVLEAELLRAPGLNVVPLSRRLVDAGPESVCSEVGLSCWKSLGPEERLHVAEHLGADEILSGEYRQGIREGHLRVELTLSAVGRGSVVVEGELADLPDRLSASLARLLRRQGLRAIPSRRLLRPEGGRSLESWKLHTEALLELEKIDLLSGFPIGERVLAVVPGGSCDSIPECVRQRILGEALGLLERACALTPDDPELWITTGTVKLRGRRLVEETRFTRELFNEVIRKEEKIAAIIHLARLFDAKKVEEILDREVVRHNAGAAEGAALLGREAAADFQRALDLAPDSIPALLGRGSATEDRSLLEEARARNPLLAVTHAALAESLQRAGDSAASLESWQLCLALSPRRPECLLGVGEALMALGRIDKAVTALAGVLGSNHWQFELRAAEKLGSLGDRRATAPLVGLLEDPVWWLSQVALRSLAALGDKEATPAIQRALARPKIEKEVIGALGVLGRSEEQAALGDFLDLDGMPLVELVTALDRIGVGWLDRHAVEVLLARDTPEALWGLRPQVCQDCESYLRSELAQADLGSSRQRQILLLLLKVGSTGSLQDLWQLPETSVEMLSAFLEHGSPVRWDDESLLAALHSGADKRAGLAALAITRQDIKVSDDVRKALRALLPTASDDSRFSLLRALAIAGREAPGIFLRYLEDKQVYVRIEALEGLAAVDRQGVIAPARRALTSNEGDEATRAIDLLVRYDEDGQSCSDLREMLSKRSALRFHLLGALGSLHCPEALAVVLPFLGDDDPQLRLAALQAVWQLAGAEAAPQLREAAHDPSPVVRALATLYLRLGGEGKISAGDLGPLAPADWEAGILRTELDLRLPELLPKLSLEEIRSIGQLADPDFASLPFTLQTLAMVHFATAAPRPARRLAALSSLSRRDAASQRLDKAAILDIWTSAGKALPREKLAENPYLSYFLADTLKEQGESAEALVWVRTATASLPASPAEETVLRIALAWVEAESLLRLGRGKDALAVLQPVERVLLPETNWFERSSSGLPFLARTLLLTALAEEARGRRQEALELLNEAERRLGKDQDLDDAGRARERKTIAGFRARVLYTLATGEAQHALHLAERYPAQRGLEREAEESAVITVLQAAIGAGDYEEAHRLTETYALRRYLASGPRGFVSGSPGRQEIVEELRALQAGIQTFERELLQAERRSSDRYGRRQEKLEDAGESEVEVARRRLWGERRRLKTFMVSLKREYPEVAALVQAEPVEMTELQSLLRDDQVILQYLLLPKKIYLFVLSSSDVSIFEAPHGQAAIDHWVKAYRKAIEQEGLPAHERAEGEAAERELVQALLAPVLPVLERYRDLVIVPNGSLHLLPFAALRVDGMYLAERWTISHLSAASLLPVVARGISANQRLVALANPVHPGWPRLPAAESEVEAIRPYFRLADVHVGKAALKTVLVQKDLRNVNLHLALHSEAGGDGGKPRLVLSDGLLEIEEVWNLYLDGAPLVVLSSCETQVGERISGDEVVSLGNGFLFAGARRVVSSLWPVSGQASRELMKSLYRHLSEGRPAAEALSLAQEEVRRMPHFAEPYYWAAFVLVGW